MKMRIIIINTIVALAIFGCSSDVTRVTKRITEPISVQDSSVIQDMAMQHMIDASVYELQGKTADAILEYQDALALDPQPGVFYSLGKAYLRLNKLGPALKNARAAVDRDSSDVEYNYLLANIYQMANLKDSAAVVYSRIISLDSTNTGAYYNLGIIYSADRPMQALEIFEKLLDITGPQWNVLVKIADLNERLGKIDETIKTIENLYELNPGSLELQKLLIESYLKIADYSKAKALVDDALTLYPDDLTLIEYKAKTEIMQSNWQKGAEEYYKIIDSDKIPFESKVQIGLAFLSQAETDSVNWGIAKNIFEKLDQDSTDWQVKSYLGEIAINSNQDSVAIQYFREASLLAEWSAPVWIRLGGLLFDNGKYDEAVEMMEKAVKSFPDEYAINLILGLSYAQLNKHTEAEPYLRKSVQLNPNDLNALASFGFTLNQINKDDEAIIYLKKALVIDPQNSQLWGILGMIYDNKEMFDKCDEAYEKAYELSPDDPLILNNYAYSLIERDLQIDRAYEMSKRAVEQDPENPSYLDTIGWIYYKKGNLDKAKEYIEKAIEFDGNDSALFDHLGDVYLKLGEVDKAKEAWQKSLDLNPDNEEIQEKIDKGTL